MLIREIIITLIIYITIIIFSLCNEKIIFSNKKKKQVIKQKVTKTLKDVSNNVQKNRVIKSISKELI